jgi:hypothetical protein
MVMRPPLEFQTVNKLVQKSAVQSTPNSHRVDSLLGKFFCGSWDALLQE